LGIGAKHQPLAASCWQGALYGARSSDSCGVLVGAFIAVLWMVLERLISLEVQWVKLLISNRDMQYDTGRKLKNRKARNIGIRMGIGQEHHCEMLFPRGFQESSTSLLHFSNCSVRGAATGESH
jgi:hypothetical protein